MMWKYHDHLHGQAQQPTPNTAASQQQRWSWHDLAGQYRLKDMLEVSGTASQSGQGVEKQFELYENGPISPCSTDIVGFWAVSTMSHYFPICITNLFADMRRNPSNIICNGMRLSANSSVLGAFWVCFFIQCWNWYKEAKSNPPCFNGGTSNVEFLLKQQHLNFTDGWAVTEDELQYYADDDEDSADLLGKLTLEVREDGIDIDEVIHMVGQDDDDWLSHFLFNINVYNVTYPHIVHFLQILLHITFTVLNVWLLNLPQHLPAITSLKPLAKPSQTGFNQLSNNYKPELAKAAG